MTQTSPTESPTAQLEKLASAVGFRRVDPSPQDAAKNLRLEVWQSDFAIMVLVRVSKADTTCLDQTFALATEWLSRQLEMDGKRGRFIDGYLLLALPTKPQDDLLKRVRVIERDTGVCRKHVLWPDENESWLNCLNAVTTLGLPPAAPLAGVFAEPELPTVARKVLEARDKGTSFYDIAAMIENMPDEDKTNVG